MEGAVRPAHRRPGARRRSAARVGRRRRRERDFGVYVHVPFCRVRCGYCDFNTYTADEVRGVKQSDYAGSGDRRDRAGPVACSRRPAPALAPRRPCSSAAARRPCCRSADLARMLAAVRDTWGLAPDAEVTTEANPDSVDRRVPRRARGGRVHARQLRDAVGRAARARDARAHARSRARSRSSSSGRATPGSQVSLDLIYGTPGESPRRLARVARARARAASGPSVSAYALIVENGTKLARQIARGEVAAARRRPAGRHVRAGGCRCSRDAGYDWYEVSNWATDAGTPFAPQPRLLDRAGLVGDRPRSAQPRRRRALVERQASGGLRGADRGRASRRPPVARPSTTRPGASRRCC